MLFQFFFDDWIPPEIFQNCQDLTKMRETLLVYFLPVYRNVHTKISKSSLMIRSVAEYRRRLRFFDMML
jgi:hypothetical protein